MSPDDELYALVAIVVFVVLMVLLMVLFDLDSAMRNRAAAALFGRGNWRIVPSGENLPSRQSFVVGHTEQGEFRLLDWPPAHWKSGGTVIFAPLEPVPGFVIMRRELATILTVLVDPAWSLQSVPVGRDDLDRGLLILAEDPLAITGLLQRADVRSALELLVPMRHLIVCECAGGDKPQLLHVSPESIGLTGAVAMQFQVNLMIFSAAELRRATHALGVLRAALMDTPPAR